MQSFIRAIRFTLLFIVASTIMTAGSSIIVSAEDGTGATSDTTQEIIVPVVTETPPTAAVETTMPVAEEMVVAATTETVIQPEEPVYTFNEQTGMWDSDEWYFDPVSGTYQPVVQPEQPSNQTLVDEANQPDPTSVSNIDNQTDVTNTLESDAETGDATVAENTDAGSATSGDAASIATILNNLNSILGLTGNQGVAGFTKDINGNVTGDIILQPDILGALLGSLVNGNGNIQTTTNLDNDSSITNNVDLSAVSGDADVTKNTQAGNATSGSADTIANIINIINSLIAANQSFVGSINIYGNLVGDILVSPDFVSQLLGSNTNQQANDETSQPNNIEVNSSNTQSITNNVSLSADTGKAAVQDNTNAGDATSGDAMTNLVILNFTGHEVIAANSLLVFVNVLGKWYGVILDAPAGTTAAAIGSDVTSNLESEIPNSNVNMDNDSQIINNVKLTSQTGDATVAKNTKAGNATSGNATASANIANFVGNQFSLSGWFGILFINVFGSWYGNFGVDTPYGNPVTEPGATTTEVPKEVIAFVPSSSEVTVNIPVAVQGIEYEEKDAIEPIVASNNNDDNGSVLSSSTEIKKGTIDIIRILMIAGSIVLIAVSLAGAKQLFYQRAE